MPFVTDLEYFISKKILSLCKTLNKRGNATTYEEVIYACSSKRVFQLRISDK
jgi:hypothetical protein